MPRMSDSEREAALQGHWRREQRHLYEEIRVIQGQLRRLENIMAMDRKEFKATFDEVLTATREARGNVASMRALLETFASKIDDLAKNAEDLEEFRAGLKELKDAAAEEAVQFVHAQQQNPVERAASTCAFAEWPLTAS
jgi:low affinity Fe/Cu permease